MNGAKYRDPWWKPARSGPQTGVKVHLPTEQRPYAHSLANAGVASGQVSKCPWVAQLKPGLEPDRTSLERLEIAAQRRSPSNLAEFERICREEWEKVPKYKCAKLVVSYPRRLGCNRCQRCLNKVLSKGSEYLCKSDINLFLLCHYGLLCVDWEGKKQFNQF